MMGSCADGCGFVAAFFGCVGFGSFGVPMKGEAANKVNVDPFVMQTYKTIMCFLTCWLVLLLGESFTFSPWGLISGLLWVTGGTGGIIGIRNAGLAISVATWSGVCVLVSLAWGILVFHERVESLFGTFVGMVMMISGLAGMAHSSSPKKELVSLIEIDNSGVIEDSLNEKLMNDLNGEELQGEANKIDDEDDNSSADTVLFLGIKLRRRVFGLMGAAADGLLGGSALVPMHYSSAGGLNYVISFAIGAAVVTVSGWLLLLSYQGHRKGSIRAGWEALPPMHIKELWLPGSLAGTLWSMGNIGNILSVTYLGEGIGMSIVQSAMMVSGLWGILWFREIEGTATILCWSSWALTTIAGIFFLGYEHAAR